MSYQRDFDDAIRRLTNETGGGNLIRANKAIADALKALNEKIDARGCPGNCGSGACKPADNQLLLETPVKLGGPSRKVYAVDVGDPPSEDALQLVKNEFKNAKPAKVVQAPVVKRGRGRPRKNPPA